MYLVRVIKLKKSRVNKDKRKSEDRIEWKAQGKSYVHQWADKGS